MPDERAELAAGIERADLRARWALVLLLAVLVCLGLSALGDVSMLEFLDRAESGSGVSEAEGEALDDRATVLALVALGCMIAATVAWMLWLHRACANFLHAGCRRTRFTPGWAVGW